jgi:hypothetical protein
MDQYATDEGGWLRALVRGSGTSGVAALAAQAGRSVEAMLADWALALAVDGLPGGAHRRRELSMPSWDLAGIMRGLGETYPSIYSATPLAVAGYGFGDFRMTSTALPAFGASYTRLAGRGDGQLVHLESAADGRRHVRMTVLRLR